MAHTKDNRRKATKTLERLNKRVSSQAILTVDKAAVFALSEMMRTGGVEVKDRTVLFRNYKNCFLGTEATHWIVSNFMPCKKKEDGEYIGNLMVEMGLIRHVQNKHGFRNKFYLYIFTEEQERRQLRRRSSVDGTNSKTVRNHTNHRLRAFQILSAPLQSSPSTWHPRCNWSDEGAEEEFEEDGEDEEGEEGLYEEDEEGLLEGDDVPLAAFNGRRRRRRRSKSVSISPTESGDADASTITSSSSLSTNSSSTRSSLTVSGGSLHSSSGGLSFDDYSPFNSPRSHCTPFQDSLQSPSAVRSISTPSLPPPPPSSSGVRNSGSSFPTWTTISSPALTRGHPTSFSVLNLTSSGNSLSTGASKRRGSAALSAFSASFGSSPTPSILIPSPRRGIPSSFQQQVSFSPRGSPPGSASTSVPNYNEQHSHSVSKLIGSPSNFTYYNPRPSPLSQVSSSYEFPSSPSAPSPSPSPSSPSSSSSSSSSVPSLEATSSPKIDVARRGRYSDSSNKESLRESTSSLSGGMSESTMDGSSDDEAEDLERDLGESQEQLEKLDLVDSGDLVKEGKESDDGSPKRQRLLRRRRGNSTTEGGSGLYLANDNSAGTSSEEGRGGYLPNDNTGRFQMSSSPVSPRVSPRVPISPSTSPSNTPFCGSSPPASPTNRFHPPPIQASVSPRSLRQSSCPSGLTMTPLNFGTQQQQQYAAMRRARSNSVFHDECDNWNTRFQEIVREMSRQSLNSTIEEKAPVNTKFMELTRDFIHAAKTYGRIIIR
jgi:hypothetical protein